ncbi:MAG: hypothetical protein HQK58_01175 [Deltaproteobacteria bacterium]|nr:hypothetical protein [Deltaproteobacteria bacterium]
MDQQNNFEAFAKAYNNFGPRPLQDEEIERFYVDDLTNNFITQIKEALQSPDDSHKILVFGQPGCGKSTTLNKIIKLIHEDNLWKNKYHIVFFSAKEMLELIESENKSLLEITYLQLLGSTNNDEVAFSHEALKFKKMTDEPSVTRSGSKIEVALKLLPFLSLKLPLGQSSPATSPMDERTRNITLRGSFCRACQNIVRQTGKKVIIIIDAIDEMGASEAIEVSKEEGHLDTVQDVKFIHTFPLETFFLMSINPLTGEYSSQFISPVPLKDADHQPLKDNFAYLKELVWKRIEKHLVAEKALEELIKLSGGVLRDLISYMQDACKEAIRDNSSIIEQDVVSRVKAKVKADYVKKYNRLDPHTHDKALEDVWRTKKRPPNALLDTLLHDSHVLEYRQSGSHTWYDAHPCLKEVLKWD